ncbi:MAG: MarR family transcriptional regulator [Bdellovibrionaceae bacterium]|nr:MarR family transcriptional regulator [Pseudobdellovibrionaceae bacterium]
MKKEQEHRIHSCMKPFLGYCLYKAAQLLKGKLEDSIKEHGMVVQQIGILHILGATGPMSQSVIAEAMETDNASMVRFVDGLEKKKYVVRSNDPNDRRIRLVTITPQGRKALEQVREVGREVEEKFIQNLTAEEKKALKTIVPKLITSASGS